KPEANYLLERLIDAAARRLGFDPADLRRRNMIADFPYTKALGSVVDCGRFAANIDDVVMLADRAGFAAPLRNNEACCAVSVFVVFSKPRAVRRTKARKFVSRLMALSSCSWALNR